MPDKFKLKPGKRIKAQKLHRLLEKTIFTVSAKKKKKLLSTFQAQTKEDLYQTTKKHEYV